MLYIFVNFLFHFILFGNFGMAFSYVSKLSECTVFTFEYHLSIILSYLTCKVVAFLICKPFRFYIWLIGTDGRIELREYSSNRPNPFLSTHWCWRNMLKDTIWFFVLNPSSSRTLYTWDTNLVITVSIHVLRPICTEPSAGSVITVELYIFPSQFYSLSMILL